MFNSHTAATLDSPVNVRLGNIPAKEILFVTVTSLTKNPLNFAGQNKLNN